MSVYNSGVKTMKVCTVLRVCCFIKHQRRSCRATTALMACLFAKEPFISTSNYDVFDLEGWAVGEAVTINALYLAYKSAGYIKQLSACDCIFCQ